MGYCMNTLLPYAPLLLKGSAVTLATWTIASIGSLFLGSLCGVASCRIFTTPLVVYSIKTYTFIAKGIPAYVQILIAYFVIPSLLGSNVSGFFAATVALIFCSGGYVTEIIRAGIESIPHGQWEACYVLGYSKVQTLTRVIAPQVIRLIMPILLGECEQLLKSTSLLATIGVTELTRAGMNIISRELNPISVYLLIALIYLFFAAGINFFIILAQKRMRYGNN